MGSQQGGAEALFRHLMEHRDSIHTYVCAFFEPGPLVEEVRSWGYSTTVFLPGRLRSVSSYITTVVALRRWMKLHHLDAVLSWMAKAHLYVAPASLLSGIPIFWYQHGTPRGELLDRVVTLLPSSMILCCSFASKQAQDKLFPSRRTVVCYPGVELSSRAVTKQRARQLLKLPNAVPIIGVVARLERWKGVHIFIESSRLLSACFPTAIFFVVGGAHPRDLPYAEEINIQVRTANLGDRLLMVGQKTANEVALWQAAADIVMHPTIGTEPFGMSIVEAMGAGAAVIASDSAGPAEIITDCVNGFLVPLGDPLMMSKIANRLLTDLELMVSITEAARDRSNRFSIETFQLRITNILAEVVDD
jgi:glycosyltransferase involved in cell wall biosynthesis